MIGKSLPKLSIESPHSPGSNRGVVDCGDLARVAVFLAAMLLALAPVAALSSAPPLSPASSDGASISAPGAGSWLRLHWFEEIARDVGLGPTSQYGGGVIRFTRGDQGGGGPALIIEIAEGFPGELIIRHIEAYRRKEDGWAATEYLIEKRGGNFELLSRQLVRRLVNDSELKKNVEGSALFTCLSASALASYRGRVAQLAPAVARALGELPKRRSYLEYRGGGAGDREASEKRAGAHAAVRGCRTRITEGSGDRTCAC